MALAASLPVNCTISASPSTIVRGQSTTITWTTTGGGSTTTLHFNGADYTVPANGSMAFTPAGSMPAIIDVFNGTKFKQCYVFVHVLNHT